MSLINGFTSNVMLKSQENIDQKIVEYKMSSSVAFVFPGQGSQSVGMLANLADKKVVVDTFAEASQALGYDLWQVIQEDANEQLHQTHVTQPALLTSSVALWRLWQESQGIQPTFLAGHSLGEYSALVCAGAICLSAAVDLVKCRGEYMQAAVPQDIGAMAAIIGLDDEAVVSACQQAQQGEVVTPVNFNSPGQVVIAGHKRAVERAMLLCKEAGAKRALPLPVSVPSHCELMQPAAALLAEKLSTITVGMPTIPVVHNVNGEVANTVDDVTNHLIAQLYMPVLWTDCVRYMQAKGVVTMVECGPGKVLTGLTKRIDTSISSLFINDADSLQNSLQQSISA